MARVVSYARKVDSTQAQVIAAFRAAGWSVWPTFRTPNGPDLVVAKAGRTICVEVKGPKTRISASQKVWHADWPGETAIVRNCDDVMRLT